MVRSFVVAVPATGTVQVIDEHLEPPNQPTGREGPSGEGGTLLVRVPSTATADVLIGGPNDSAPSLLVKAADTQPTVISNLGADDVLICQSNTGGTSTSLQVLAIDK